MRWVDDKRDRPVLDLTPSLADQMLDVASALIVVFTVAMVAMTWGRIPEQIPTHFGIGGQPDDWGPRWLVALGPILAIGFYIAFGILYKYPHRFNYAWPITAENAERQYRLARSLITWEKLWVILIFTYIAWAQVQVATGHLDELSPVVMLVLVGGVLLTSAITMVLMYRAR